MGTLAIVVSLLLLMFFAYRGVTVLILAPIMAAVAVILSGDAAVLLPAYTQTFMSALGGYVISFLPIFLLGALFGQLMADSGAAYALARWITDKLGSRHAILTVVLACAALTYGGVSLFVVAFAVYPIATALFRHATLPKRLIPASIALGSFTLTMTALPGTPSIQNAIPIPYFGTNVFAAPGLGIIAAVIMLGLGMAWLLARARRALLAGEGYGEAEDAIQAPDHGDHPGMPLALAVLPLLMVVGVNALFTYGIFPHMDFSAMGERYADIDPKRVSGLWSLIIALASACIMLIVIRLKHWADLRDTVNKGVFGFMLPLFNTASEVGYGAVIASLAGFAIIRDAVLDVAPDNPLISEAIAMGTLAGITGSSSGGMSIALATLGSDYLAMAEKTGISPELLHRVAVLASGSMDTLPHSGAIITLLSICRLTHRKSYGDIAAVTILMPVIALITVIALGTMFGSF
ncbi:GntP family permease [Bordetella holmesii]|uniref:Citrate transporter n=2 Tax=Bordetella holmesii TaxID=35814 RepID=A0A158M009_9BORD|nr:GntP family permease [Bordetella holmesii]AHV93758.1 citrate transporter family protein [Bordetella holmesii ATCC 51541]AIT25520.1 citrate transporter family protein [Bordetella holmesii 44057]EWM43032.1 citrate transporter family protein [Bordetella holmesii 41130]EWM50238.1 citrate transporter family protein [Bordetella holmesii 70147]AMD44686.1 citrate transporter [Bordetella holmesii H558]